MGYSTFYCMLCNCDSPTNETGNNIIEINTSNFTHPDAPIHQLQNKSTTNLEHIKFHDRIISQKYEVINAKKKDTFD